MPRKVSRGAWKLYWKFVAKRHDWRPKDFRKLYEGFGFLSRAGNHDVYYHPNQPGIPLATVGRHNYLARGYADDAVARIEMLITLEGLTQENTR